MTGHRGKIAGRLTGAHDAPSSPGSVSPQDSLKALTDVPRDSHTDRRQGTHTYLQRFNTRIQRSKFQRSGCRFTNVNVHESPTINYMATNERTSPYGKVGHVLVYDATARRTREGLCPSCTGYNRFYAPLGVSSEFTISGQTSKFKLHR